MANTKVVKNKQKLLARRKRRVRGKVSGTSEIPRLSMFRSAKHVYAQVIDDVSGVTLASVSSFEKGNTKPSNVDGCVELGKILAERCKAKNVSKVVFDKNGKLYHGRVKAFADAARESGLKF